MLLGRLLRDQQDKQQADGFAVRRIERTRRGETQKSAARGLESLDPSVWDGDPTAKAGGAKFFTREKTVENGAAGNALVVLEKDPGLFKYAFFAAGVEIENDVIEGEKVTEVGHKSAKIRCAWESRLYRGKAEGGAPKGTARKLFDTQCRFLSAVVILQLLLVLLDLAIQFVGQAVDCGVKIFINGFDMHVLAR